MQEFLLLVHGKGFKDESTESLKVHLENYQNWVDHLLEEDKFIRGSRLTTSGKVVLDRDTVVSDGPFLESKELVGGYILIRAQNLDEATKLALDCPLSEELPISVRPMYVYEHV